MGDHFFFHSPMFDWPSRRNFADPSAECELPAGAMVSKSLACGQVKGIFPKFGRLERTPCGCQTVFS